MADENSFNPDDPSRLSFDPDQIELLFAGNLADDDAMWIVRCSVQQLHALVERPVEWVALLGTLPNWRWFGSDEPAPAPILTHDFAMLVQTTKVEDLKGWVTVQGISGTNALTVVASRASAVASIRAMKALGEIEGDPFRAFWEDVARDEGNPPTMRKLFPVNVVKTNSRFYAHFEILDRKESPAERAARTATFFLASALDPAGYAAMLNSLDQRTLYIESDSIVPGEPISVDVPEGASVVYANVETGHDDPSTNCAVLDGPTTPPEPTPPPTGTVGGTVVKRYGGEGG